MSVSRLIEQHWRKPKWYLGWLLWPLSRIFYLLSRVRFHLYRLGVLRVSHLPCPLIVVGKVHAGGVGKTPVVSALVSELQQRGLRVGVISRGYGRKSRETVLLHAGSEAADTGDEPLMLFRQTGAPVAVGTGRLAAAKLLLQNHPDLQVIISDDGLQHYALARDMEIVVFPYADAGRSMDLLPNGPLRESVHRLSTAEAVILTGASAEEGQKQPSFGFLPAQIPSFFSQTEYGVFYQLRSPQHTASGADFAGRHCAAVAAIGHPERFFNALHELNVPVEQQCALADHATICPENWPRADAVFITEKDAVKLPRSHADEPDIWVLPLRAKLPAALTDLVLSRLKLDKKAIS